MRAWMNDTDHDRIELREIPSPVPGPGQLLIEVKAVGVNRADLAMRQGRYRPGVGAVDVAGIEGSGVVVATGPDCRQFAVGDRVMGMCTGTLAEFCCIDEEIAMAVPDECGFVDAAVLPVGVCTEHDALVTRAGLRPGETVLVTAATAGVGELACKLARLLGAGTIIGTTRSPERAARVSSADHVVVSGEHLVDEVLGITGDRGVDVIVDHVAGAEMQHLIEVAAVGGRIVSVGRLGGSVVTLDIDELQRRRASLIGVTFRTRSRADYGAIAAAAAADLTSAIASGALRALVEQTFPFDQADLAQQALSNGDFVGKLVIEVSS